MVWEWSHTAEAYAYAREQVQQKDRKWLEVVYAEWEAFDEKDSGHVDGFNQKRYERALKKAKKLDVEVLADAIWDRMSEHARCEAGGFEAWACPYGCGPHLVPFSPPEEEKEEDVLAEEEE